jgi:transcriptional regulator with XRE-family HTH domain
MTKRSDRTFGRTIRERRLHLGVTQREVALRIGASTPYIGHLEANKRHPSDKVLERLAKALDLDPGVLFMSANPVAERLIKSTDAVNGTSAWDALREDKTFQRLHHITLAEIKFLSTVAKLGEVSSRRDYLQILNVIRHTLKR